MKAKLVLISPDAEAKEFKISPPTKIGRGQEAKLKLMHPLVSRVHCEIYEQGETLMVRDMASLNGTFVDDERVADEMALPSGCRLTVGSAQFHVLYGDDYDRPLEKKAVKSDAPTKLAEETVRVGGSRPHGGSESSANGASDNGSGGSDELDDLWSSPAPDHQEQPVDATRGMDFDFLSNESADEATAPAKQPSPAKAEAKPAGAAKPAAAKPAAAKPAAAKPAAAKPAAAKPTAATAKPAAKLAATPAAKSPSGGATRPPNPAEFADEEEIASSGKPFMAKGHAAPAASASADSPDTAPGAAEENAGEPASDTETAGDTETTGDDDDLDDFLKSIM